MRFLVQRRWIVLGAVTHAGPLNQHGPTGVSAAPCYCATADYALDPNQEGSGSFVTVKIVNHFTSLSVGRVLGTPSR